VYKKYIFDISPTTFVETKYSFSRLGKYLVLGPLMCNFTVDSLCGCYSP